MTDPFNPLAMDNLGRSITTAMLDTGATRMTDLTAFYGAGIYAIYYRGEFPAYQRLVNQAAVEYEVPIYVGKAIPQGGRKGVVVQATSITRTLSSRVRQHAGSIGAAENLELEDFWCRWLVVDPIWIPLGENVLIGRFAPVWNTIVDGFGNHDPGSGRHAGVRSRWDTMHPGRPWAPKFPARAETAADIASDVEEYVAARYQV